MLRYIKPIIARCIPVFLTLALVACAGNEERSANDLPKTGEKAGLFTGHWWSYYQRGLSFVAEGSLENARSDFEQAIDLRDGDRWRARTYGMHFLDYFPKRELGIVWLQIGDPEQALKWLEASSSDDPSDRAYYFAVQARQELLRGSAEDTQGPIIRMDPPYELITNRPRATLRGVVQDPSFVTLCEIDREPVFLPSASSTIRFEKEVDLEYNGGYLFQVSALDMHGNSTSLNYSVICDKRGPQIEYRDKGHFQIAIRDYEDLITEVRYDDTVICPNADVNYYYASVNAPFVPKTITAKDRAGNITRFTVPDSIRARFGFLPRRYCVADSSADPPSPPLNPIQVTLENLPKMTTSQQVAVNFSYYSTEPVASVSVNEYQVPAIFGRRSQAITFLYTLPDEDVVQTIRVTARTKNGAEDSVTASITYQQDPIKLMGTRLKLALVEPDSANHPQILDWTEAFSSELANTRRFMLLDRTLLSNLVLENLIGGKVRFATAEVLSQLRVRNTYQATSDRFSGHEIENHLVDVQSTRTLPGATVYIPKESPLSTRYYLQGLAGRTVQRFPRIDGTVTKKSRRSLMFDRGSEDEIHTGARVSVVHQEVDTAPVIVDGQIEKTRGHQSEIVVIDRSLIDSIKVGDTAVLK